METPGCPKILWSHPQQMHLPENLKSRIGGRVTPGGLAWKLSVLCMSLPRPSGKRYTTQLYSYLIFIPVSLSFFNHSAACLTTEPQPLPNQVLHRVRSGVSSPADEKFRAIGCHQNSFRNDSRLLGYDALSSGKWLLRFAAA